MLYDGEKSFNDFYNNNDTFLTLFSKETCGPCFRLKPQLKRLVNEIEIPLVEIDVDKERTRFDEYELHGTPIVILIREKELLNTWAGYQGRNKYKRDI